MAFRSPILGGQTLLRPSIQSPNYAAGSAGWSVRADGSAEFNNLTLRGTYVGADYVQNANGTFVYSSTPAAGNLIASLGCAAAGVDAFGNHYLAGTTSYGSGLFSQLVGGKLVTGQIVAGVPDTTDAGGLFTNTTNVYTQLVGVSTATGTTTNPPAIEIFAGDINQTTGATNAPQVVLSDSFGNSPADFYMSGTMVKTANNTSRYIWHAPALNAGYTNQNCQYRLNVLDELHWQGEFSQNAAQAGAGSATIFTLTGAYVPKTELIVGCSWRTSTGAAKGGGAFLAFETSGAVILGWPSATAAGDRFSCAVDVGLNNVP